MCHMDVHHISLPIGRRYMAEILQIRRKTLYYHHNQL